MLAEGVASASDIDTAMKLGYLHPWALGAIRSSGPRCSNGHSEQFGRAFEDESYRPHPC